MYVKKDEIDTDKVCKYYNNKYKIDMHCLHSVSEEIGASKTNTGCIIPTGAQGHYYGAVLVDIDDKNKYCIIADTIKTDQRIALQRAKQDNRQIIRIGEGLQKDVKNCKVFAINMVKYLLKDDCKIAKSLIDFYLKNKRDNYTNISSSIFESYKECDEKNIKTDKEYKTLGELLKLYKQDREQVDRYVEEKDLGFEFYFLLDHDQEIKEIEKGEGVTLLYDVPNEKFLKWEYAGEFLKLAQSLNLQSKAFDKKAGKKQVELKNYANFYSSLGDKVDDIVGIDKEKLKDKTVSTKIYCKKEKYKNLTNNNGLLNEEEYQKKIKPMINFDAVGCEQLKGKFNKINK